MAQYHFGTGNFFGVLPGATPTPVRLGALQDVSIDFKGNLKELNGQNKFALVVAQGTMKVTGKAKFAQISVAAYNSLFFGMNSVATGQTKFVDSEPGTIGASPYTVTVANAATWTLDLGVVDATTGLPLTRVATAPTTGQYTVAAGAYVFSAADTGKQVYVSYMYTVAASGKTLTITNQAMGVAPTFKGIFAGNFGGKSTLMVLNSCTSNSLKLIDTKLEDYNMPELEFSASVDAGGQLGILSADE